MTKTAIEQLLIAPGAPLSEAISAIRTGGANIVFVVDPERRLLGCVTDGDVRRALLAGFDLTALVQQAMAPEPYSAPVGRSRALYYQVMRANAVFQLPLVDESRRVVDVVLLSEIAQDADRPNRVVLMAGGLGTRLRPLTDKTPKPMLRVGGRPILQGIIERFIDCGFRNFTISLNYLGDLIENHFKDGSPLGVRIDYLRENKRLGTAGCLSLLPEIPDQDIFVMNGDILTDIDFRDILAFHHENAAAATMAVNRYNHDVPFGVVELEQHRITGIREKPTFSYFVNTGVYVLSPEALRQIPKDTFYDMPSLFEDLRGEKQCVSAFPLHEYWMDIGRPEDLSRANEAYRQVFPKTREAGS